MRGTYDDVNRLCTELSGDRDWAFVNVNVRPYYAEGSKTVAFEIAEQLGFALPDRIVAPIASGSLFTKIGRGFQEWLDVGLVEGELPTFNGAQADGCAPVASAFEQGHEICRPVRPDTIAKSLAIGNPADGPYALDLARRSGGSVDSVTDDEIREGIRLLAQTTGIFTETAGGVTTAMLRKLAERGDIGAGERVVLVITGDGLKTLDAVRGTSTATRSTPASSRSRQPCPGRPSAPCNLPDPHDRHGQDSHPAAERHERRLETSVAGATTVGEVLDGLYDRYDGLRERIAEDGDLRRFVNVYVGGEDIRFLDGLETSVEDGDEVTILPAVAGG